MSSQSEQEGVEAMLGLGLAAGAGPAEEPGEDEEDEVTGVGALIKTDPADIVRHRTLRQPTRRLLSNPQNCTSLPLARR